MSTEGIRVFSIKQEIIFYNCKYFYFRFIFSVDSCYSTKTKMFHMLNYYSHMFVICNCVDECLQVWHDIPVSCVLELEQQKQSTLTIALMFHIESHLSNAAVAQMATSPDVVVKKSLRVSQSSLAAICLWPHIEFLYLIINATNHSNGYEKINHLLDCQSQLNINCKLTADMILGTFTCECKQYIIDC